MQNIESLDVTPIAVPGHDSFVGIDSDGCVFDTMEIKQKECFHPEIVRHWHLEAVEPYVRETAEFVNLYSRGRGRNRFLCLLEMFDLLRARREVRDSGVQVPACDALRRFVDSGIVLGNPALETAVAATGDPELASLLQWSLAVNERVAEKVPHIAPFNGARRALERMQGTSDVIVVSQTPCEALLREWRENRIDAFVSVIAGQELGTKTEHLALATGGRYAPHRVLMIGDAPGDHRAAVENGACFYPINPTREETSWERFCTEAYDRFLAGTYAGEYENACIAEFEALLPEAPPWKD